MKYDILAARPLSDEALQVIIENIKFYKSFNL